MATPKIVLFYAFAPLADPDAKERLAKLGVRSKASSAADLGKFTKAELDRYGTVINSINLKID